MFRSLAGCVHSSERTSIVDRASVGASRGWDPISGGCGRSLWTAHRSAGTRWGLEDSTPATHLHQDKLLQFRDTTLVSVRFEDCTHPTTTSKAPGRLTRIVWQPAEGLTDHGR